MSSTDRDRRGRPHSEKDCQQDRRTLRYSQGVNIEGSIAESGTDDNSGEHYSQHAFMMRRCIRCNTDWIDASIHEGLDECPGKQDDAPIAYSTATGEEPVSSHRFLKEEP